MDPDSVQNLGPSVAQQLKTQFLSKTGAKIHTQLTCFGRELASKILVGSCIHVEGCKKGRDFPGNMEIKRTS